MEETPQGLRLNIDGIWRSVQLQRLGTSPRFVLTLDDKIIEVLAQEETDAFTVQIASRDHEVETGRRSRVRPRDREAKFENGKWLLVAPLSGVVIETKVAEGDAIQDGDVIAVVEAMKMLNDLQSKVTGTVSSVMVTEKERVEIGQPLIEIAEGPQDDSATPAQSP